VEATLGSSGVEAAHHVEADVNMEAALDSDGSEVSLRSSGMGWCQAHGSANVEVALGSSGVEAAHHIEVDFGVEAVLDSDSSDVASRWA
jgi:hypothetical protein